MFVVALLLLAGLLYLLGFHTAAVVVSVIAAAILVFVVILWAIALVAIAKMDDAQYRNYQKRRRIR